MRCQRAASPARGLRAPWVSRSHGRFRPPGARRAFAGRDLITHSVLGTLQIAVSVVFMVSPLDPGAGVPAVPVTRTGISSRSCGPLMHRRWRRHGNGRAGGARQRRWGATAPPAINKSRPIGNNGTLSGDSEREGGQITPATVPMRPMRLAGGEADRPAARTPDGALRARNSAAGRVLLAVLTLRRGRMPCQTRRDS